ncbi:Hypothetical predicted protein [Octopus vulgaris]|uniref:Uncharacterized protein n=1 Tax=Octopus vulgaris TaxID=6645 RepID=A0AA36AQH0_OCTVU|nr:Hypothetical predicted protein [Octopus vulgaris]
MKHSRCISKTVGNCSGKHGASAIKFAGGGGSSCDARSCGDGDCGTDTGAIPVRMYAESGKRKRAKYVITFTKPKHGGSSSSCDGGRSDAMTAMAMFVVALLLVMVLIDDV